MDISVLIGMCRVPRVAQAKAGMDPDPRDLAAADSSAELVLSLQQLFFKESGTPAA